MADALSQMYLMTDLLMPASSTAPQTSYFEPALTVSGMEHVNTAAWGNPTTAGTQGITDNPGTMMQQQWGGPITSATSHNGSAAMPTSLNLPRNVQYNQATVNNSNTGNNFGQYSNASMQHQQNGATYMVQNTQPVYPSDTRSFNDGAAMEKNYLLHNRIPPDSYIVNHSSSNERVMAAPAGSNGYVQQQYYQDLTMENAQIYGLGSSNRMPNGAMVNPPHSQRMRPYILPANQSQRRQVASAGVPVQSQPFYASGPPDSVRYSYQTTGSQQMVQPRGYQQVPVKSGMMSAGIPGAVRATVQYPFVETAGNTPSIQHQHQHNNSYPTSTGMAQSPMYSHMQTAPSPMQYSGTPQQHQQTTYQRNGETGYNISGQPVGAVQIQQIPNPNCNIQIQPFLQAPDDEPRMTLTLPEEPVLPPFKLEHNLQVSKHDFTLTPKTFEVLRTNPDFQLELKCFQHSDAAARRTNWPDAISITVNGTPVCIQRNIFGEPRSLRVHRPLHIKQLCLPPGKKNQIVITASACCCSHLFLLHIVHRPTIRSFLSSILKKRVLPIENCMQKITQILLGPNRVFLPPSLLTNNGEMVVSLNCPFSRQRIVIPARSSNCRHYACWDLNNFLFQNSEINYFTCPLCKEPAFSDQIEVDHFLWSILKQLSPCEPGAVEVDEILIDSNGSWKPSRSAIRLSEPTVQTPKYHPVSPAANQQHWESSPTHHFPQELPRSLSTGRSTPGRGGPSSVGHPLSMCSMTSDYGSPASLSAIVPVSPSAKSFPGSVASCPQESPIASSMTHGGRTPVPQSMQYSAVGSFPSTPKTPAGGQVHSTASNLDFFDVFDGEGDTDAEALQLLSEMDPSDFLSLLDGPLLGNSSTTTFPNSTGNASDSGISNVSSSTPAHSSEDESSVKCENLDSSSQAVT